MSRGWKIFTSLFLSALVSLSSISVGAQSKQPPPDQTMQRERTPGPFVPQGPPPGDNVWFVASEMNFDGKIVKGAPYSAQAVTETIQALSDGNRIVNKSTATVYRDSEGRTRREQSLRVIGPYAANVEPPQTIFINDPVAGVNYALDTRSHTAHKMGPMRFEFKYSVNGDGPSVRTGGPQPEMSAPQVFERTAPPPGMRMRVGGPPPAQGDGSGMVFERTGPGTPSPGGEPGMVFQWKMARDENAKNESLGKQNIEGVEAEGTRNTVEIPAGEIGNERAIQIVFERWYSPELQLVVMTRHSDPRFGETTYRLTNINRSEPARELFDLPGDYTVADSAPAVSSTSIGGINGGVMNGKAITLPLPEYPAIAKQAKAAGSVTVEITIDEEGNVVSARSTSGHPLLQSAAVTAAREAKFSPTRMNGQPIKVNGVLVYTFKAQ